MATSALPRSGEEGDAAPRWGRFFMWGERPFRGRKANLTVFAQEAITR
jgi:hypothetical protein